MNLQTQSPFLQPTNIHAWKPAKVYTFVPCKVSWLKCCALSAKSEQYSLVPGCRSSKERLRWVVGISQAIVLVGRLVILESCKKESRKIRCTNMNGTRQACPLLKHGWNLMSQITMSLKKKHVKTCLNMSMSIWHSRSITAPSDMFKGYCEQWLLPLWPALTVVSSPICPKWMADFPTALMGYPFAWPAEPDTGSCGSWGEKDQKVLLLFSFRIPFRLRQTLAMILGFANEVMVVYGTFCIEDVLILFYESTAWLCQPSRQ